jgi:excisionase family DNA binding protein
MPSGAWFKEVQGEDMSSQQDTLTTREAAEILGVGTTSIKRWADAGLLPCVKTPGGHRRFQRDVINAFVECEKQPPSADVSERVSNWVSNLIALTPRRRIFDILRVERRQLGSWFLVADGVCEVLEEVGRRWARKELSLVHEHIATDRLSRALNRCCELVKLPDNPRTALLAVAEEEAHALELCLAELCFREAGWATTVVPRGTPITAICEQVSSGSFDVVAISASSHLKDSQSLARQAQMLTATCQQNHVELILGGRGNWPEQLTPAHRVRSFADQCELLHKIANPQPSAQTLESPADHPLNTNKSPADMQVEKSHPGHDGNSNIDNSEHLIDMPNKTDDSQAARFGQPEPFVADTLGEAVG